MSIGKNGIITIPNKYENLYSGKQHNLSCGSLTYDFETDVFKDYGFNTCLKWTPPSSYSSSTTLAYSYLINPTTVYDLSQEYVVSMYVYVPSSCNANFRLHLEHNNTWISNYQGTTSNINDSTKDKVIWVWGKCKVNTSDGKMYIMFYPNPNSGASTFTTGYILFAGITISLGNEIIRPNGGGFSIADKATISKNNITAKDFYEI